ncbi:MAG: TonB family protein [Caulobacteraceae bacterium]|nr:TonB family protein [Caulobacteraceae bacterium]
MTARILTPAIGLALAGVLPAIAPARAAEPAATPATVDRKPPEWVSRPSPEQFASLFPERAAKEHVSGTATLRCLIGLDQKLNDCQVLDEGPAGYGFGQVALGMAALSLMAPPTENGRPVANSPIRIPYTLPAPPDRKPAQWAYRPTQAQFDALYPPRARRERIGGAAKVRCRLGLDERLSQCTVLDEAPAGYGFGQALLGLAALAKFLPPTVNGQPVYDEPFDLAYTFGAGPPTGAPIQASPAGTDRPASKAAGTVNPLPHPRPIPSKNASQGRGMEAGIQGDVTLSCLVDLDQHLRDCKVAIESPAGQGFGEAALRMSATMLAPAGGQTTPDGRVTVPIRFNPAPEPNEQSWWKVRPAGSGVRAPDLVWVPGLFAIILSAAMALALFWPVRRRAG